MKKLFLVLPLLIGCGHLSAKEVGYRLGTSSKIATEAHAQFLDEGQKLQEEVCRAKNLPDMDARVECMGMFSSESLAWWADEFFPVVDTLRYALFIALTTDASADEIQKLTSDLIKFMALHKDKLRQVADEARKLKQR